jgi:hypothetical protein
MNTAMVYAFLNESWQRKQTTEVSSSTCTVPCSTAVRFQSRSRRSCSLSETLDTSSPILELTACEWMV